MKFLLLLLGFAMPFQLFNHNALASLRHNYFDNQKMVKNPIDRKTMQCGSKDYKNFLSRMQADIANGRAWYRDKLPNCDSNTELLQFTDLDPLLAKDQQQDQRMNDLETNIFKSLSEIKNATLQDPILREMIREIIREELQQQK